MAPNDSSAPDLPHLVINADLTITAGASAQVFNCTPGVALIQVGSDGHLIKAGPGATTSFTPVDNDGALTVEAGILHFKGGANNHSGGATSDGDYLAGDGATLDFEEGVPPVIAGRLGGDGTIEARAFVDVSAAATVDPNELRVYGPGIINLDGTSSVTLPVLTLDGSGFQATLDSERPVTATQLSVTNGAIQGPFTLTVASGGSFSKTGSGRFYVSNNGVQGVQSSADLVLNVDASLEGGSICMP